MSSEWCGGVSELAWYAPSAVSMSAWATHQVTIDAALALVVSPRPGHTLTARTNLALGGLTTRLPWSNNPLLPGRTQIASFFISGTELAGPGRLRRVSQEVSWVRPLRGQWLGGVVVSAAAWGDSDPRQGRSLEYSLSVRMQRTGEAQ